VKVCPAAGGGGRVVGKAGCCLEDEDDSGVYRVTRDPAVSATVLGRKRCDGRENGTTFRADDTPRESREEEVDEDKDGNGETEG
jgi:hypothetical protein